MRPWSMLLIALAVIPIPARPATYTLETYDCQGVATQVYHDSHPGTWQEVFDDCPEAFLWSEVSGRTGRGLLRAWARGVDLSEGGVQTWSGRAGIGATMQFDDFIIRGPGPTVTTWANFEFHAHLTVDSPSGSSTASVEFSVGIGTNNYFLGVASVNDGSDPYGTQAGGLLEGLLEPAASGYVIDGIVSTPPVEIPVNSTFTMYVVMRADAESYNPSGPADAVADAGQTVSFPEFDPVFVLPAGYTVESQEAGIADNQWGGDVPVLRPSWGALKARY